MDVPMRNTILTKLKNIQGELKAPKSQYNKFGNYNYRNCEDILEALKPLLSKNNCVVTIEDEVICIGERYYIKSRAALKDCETGESIFTTANAREEETKKGMDASQITGSASSYARKYALNGLFGIDDNKDSDAANNGKGETDYKDKSALTDAQIKRLYAIAKSSGKSEEDIKIYIKKKYGKDSTKELTKAEYDETCSRLQDAANK